jgi:hypothetical protein
MYKVVNPKEPLTIRKYPFRVSDEVKLMMPYDAKIIKVAIQNDVPCIWAIVNPKLGSTQYTFVIKGTGHDFTRDSIGEHIETFTIGPFVWHMFEEYKNPDRVVMD